MEKGKVSIIVPCYNQAQYLAETLDSVLAQTYKNLECIIIIPLARELWCIGSKEQWHIAF